MRRCDQLDALLDVARAIHALVAREQRQQRRPPQPLRAAPASALPSPRRPPPPAAPPDDLAAAAADDDGGAGGGDGDGDSDGNGNEAPPRLLCADEFLPIFVYALVHARVLAPELACVTTRLR